MLKHEVYQRTSEVFGTVVGVANIIGFTNVLDESNKKDFTPEEYKVVTDELDINTIICKAIDTNRYKELQRNLYKHSKKRHPRIKDITIYKRAWEDTKWK